jgi:hypothetical protein
MPFLRPFYKDYVQVDVNNERQWDAAKVKVQLLKSLPNGGQRCISCLLDNCCIYPVNANTKQIAYMAMFLCNLHDSVALILWH